MNVYRRLDASFWCKNVEYPLYSFGFDERDDSIDVIAYARHPELERGCIGNLIIKAVGGHEIETSEDVPNQEDCYRNVLLGRIQVYSAEPEEAPSWKYTFLKD